MDKEEPAGSYTVGIDFGNKRIIGYIFVYEHMKLIPIKESTSSSNIDMPAYVSYLTPNRIAGEQSLRNLTNYLTTTFFDLNKLISLKFDDTKRISFSNNVCFKLEAIKDNFTGIKLALSNDEQSQILRPEQCISYLLKSLLSNISLIEDKHIQNKSFSSCYLSVLPWWDIYHRQALYDAASIIKINSLGLINTTTAAAMKYAFDNFYEDIGKSNTMFIDFGDSSMNVSIANYVSIGPDTLRTNILSTVSDLNISGSHISDIIRDIFIKKLKEIAEMKNEKIIVNSDDESLVKAFLMEMNRYVIDAKIKYYRCERFEVDIGAYLSDGYKFIAETKEFEENISELTQVVTKPIQKALEDAHLDKNQLNEIIIIGGSAYVKPFITKIGEFFNRELRIDRKAAEYVAQGMGYIAAMLDPKEPIHENFEIKEIYQECIIDNENDDINIYAKWKENGEDKNILLFEKGIQLPSEEKLLVNDKIELIRNNNLIGVIHVRNPEYVNIELNISHMIKVKENENVKYEPHYGLSEKEIQDFINIEDQMQQNDDNIVKIETIKYNIESNLNELKRLTDYVNESEMKIINVAKENLSSLKKKSLQEASIEVENISGIVEQIDEIYAYARERKGLLEYCNNKFQSLKNGVEEEASKLVEQLKREGNTNLYNEKYEELNKLKIKLEILKNWYYQDKHCNNPEDAKSKEDIFDYGGKFSISIRDFINNIRKTKMGANKENIPSAQQPHIRCENDKNVERQHECYPAPSSTKEMEEDEKENIPQPSQSITTKDENDKNIERQHECYPAPSSTKEMEEDEKENIPQPPQSITIKDENDKNIERQHECYPAPSSTKEMEEDEKEKIKKLEEICKNQNKKIKELEEICENQNKKIKELRDTTNEFIQKLNNIIKNL
ncbi:dnaK protein [Histomonas meleagridis]|uniref:dnaK protein n=1 Tax=Histomonas meleagridis TaxID=135588 RepID=UPI00355996C9|nr:dnaK protein [Histomonas meleagridis]